MDLRAIGRAVRRQFPIVLLIAIVTVVVAMSAAKDVQSEYEGRASLLFVSSPAALDMQGKPITVNPFGLAGNGELVASSTVLALSRNPAFAEQLRSNGASGDVKFRRTSDAILEVRAQASTPAAALGTLATAVTMVSDQFASTQASAGAPLGSYMKIETIATTDHAREIKGSALKSVGAVALVGIVVAIAAALALDAVAPNGFRSGVRWVVRSGRSVAGRLTLAPASAGPRSPSVAPRSPPGVPDDAPPPPMGASRETAPAERPPGVGPASTTAGNGNRQTRRQAARAANRIARRDPVARRTNDGDGASRPGSRSA